MALLIALAFLTAIPVPLRGELRPESYARSVRYFPLVGLLVGLIYVGSDFLLRLAFQPLVVGALLIVVALALTGALHLEGFIDSCDGLLCAPSPEGPEKRLEIMKDSRVGAFGVAGAGALLLLRFAALTSLPNAVRPQALLFAPLLSRWAMAFAMTVFPYGRSNAGLGKIFKDYVSWKEGAIATVITLLLVSVLGQLSGLLAFAVALMVTLLGARFALGRIPGLTGDVYGAINELCEVAVLLAVPAIAGLALGGI